MKKEIRKLLGRLVAKDSMRYPRATRRRALKADPLWRDRETKKTHMRMFGISGKRVRYLDKMQRLKERLAQAQ